jgi:hypothetical protein
MVGDTNDIVSRLRQVLPARWFGDTAPKLNAILTGFASAWSGLHSLLQSVKAQGRIATASGLFLDMAAVDYFGSYLPRRAGEADAAYRQRIQSNLILPRATRPAVAQAVTALTGRAPRIFEPRNATDTGGYSSIALGYNITGGYGSLNTPYQFFITVYRPNATSASHAGGYNNGPGGYNSAPLYYVDVAELSGTLSDAEIYAAVAGVLPTNGVAWTNISN